MIETNAFKKGVCFVYKGEPMIIADYTVILNESIRSGEKFEEVDMERHKASFMYSDGTDWHFMDDETYDQFFFDKKGLGGAELYLSDGIEGLQAVLIDGVILAIELPLSVDMTVTECDPTIKGATAQAQLKPATTEGGLIVQVPSYLSVGERIRVDTRDGHFLERAK
jgi:elongation factor P